MRCPIREPRGSVMKECEADCAWRVVVDVPLGDGDWGAVRACAVAVIASQGGRFAHVDNFDTDEAS